MDYKSFHMIFKELTDDKKMIVLEIMRKFEHTTPKIDYSKALNLALKESIYSMETLLRKIREIAKIKYNIIDEEHLYNYANEDTIKSIFKRGSTKSSHYDEILDILGIDDNYLQIIYYDYLKTNEEGLFETMSAADQNTIYNLVLALKNSEEDISYMYDEIDLNG